MYLNHFELKRAITMESFQKLVQNLTGLLYRGYNLDTENTVDYYQQQQETTASLSSTYTISSSSKCGNFSVVVVQDRVI